MIPGADYRTLIIVERQKCLDDSVSGARVEPAAPVVYRHVRFFERRAMTVQAQFIECESKRAIVPKGRAQRGSVDVDVFCAALNAFFVELLTVFVDESDACICVELAIALVPRFY